MSSLFVIKWVRSNWELLGWIGFIFAVWIAAGIFYSAVLFRFTQNDDE